jgi:hypothetical protein
LPSLKKFWSNTMANWRIKKQYLSDDGCFARGGGIEVEDNVDPTSVDASQIQFDVPQAAAPQTTPQIDVNPLSAPVKAFFAPPSHQDTYNILGPGYDPNKALWNQGPAAPAATTATSPARPMQDTTTVSAPAPAPDGTGMKQFVGGIQNEAKAQGVAADAQAEAYNQQAQGMEQFQNMFQSNMQQHTAQVDAIVQGMQNQTIDPDHFINSSSTGGKVGLAIGLMLGGLGQGLAQGKENPVMGVIQQRIKDDINAQVENRKGKENLLTTLEKQYGNKQDAVRMMSAAYTAQMAAKISEAAARSGSPMAKARADQVIGQLKMQAEQQVAGVAQSATVKQMVASGQMGQAEAIPLLVPKEHQKAAFEELNSEQVINKSIGNIQHVMDRVAKLQGDRLTSPIQSKSEINALNLEISALGKEMFGRLNEQELKMLDNAKVAFTDSKDTIARKTDIVKSIIDKSRKSSVLQSFGLAKQPEQQQSAPQTKTVNGVKYMRGPDGRAVPVK